MFGLFGKKAASNSSFNNMLVSALGESIRKNNAMPNEEQLFALIESLLKLRNLKLSGQQINNVRACASMLSLGSGASDFIPLLTKFNEQMPRGEITAFEQIISLLERRFIISSD